MLNKEAAYPQLLALKQFIEARKNQIRLEYNIVNVETILLDTYNSLIENGKIYNINMSYILLLIYYPNICELVAFFLRTDSKNNLGYLNQLVNALIKF